MTAVGIMAVGSTVLAACGGGTTGTQAGSDTTSSGGGPATAPAPTSTIPGSVATTAQSSTTSTTSTTAGTTSASQGPMLIVKAFGGSVAYVGTQPSTIDFSADSTNIVQDLTWSSWGPTSAVGHGTVGLNKCQPNCATGTVQHVPVAIHLSDVVQGHFTAMTEKASTGFARSFRYPSNWATGAS